MSQSASESAWIQDVETTQFQKAVIERSKELPVLVDFWAAWCEPCRQLGPALERLASEGDGRFLLVKIDVDKSPELAQALQVQGIPTVIGFRDGKIADGFTGALPETELRAFLDRFAPVTVSPLEQALALEESGDGDGAVKLLRNILRETPGHAQARLTLARMLLDADRAPEARLVFDKLSEVDRSGEEGRSLESRMKLLEGVGDADELHQKFERDPDDVATRIDLGRALLADGRYDGGLEHLLEAVRIDREYDDQAARKAMLEAFVALGEENPLVGDYRFKLQMILL